MTPCSFRGNGSELLQDIDKIPEYADVEPRTSKGPHQWYVAGALAKAKRILTVFIVEQALPRGIYGGSGPLCGRNCCG